MSSSRHRRTFSTLTLIFGAVRLVRYHLHGRCRRFRAAGPSFGCKVRQRGQILGSDATQAFGRRCCGRCRGRLRRLPSGSLPRGTHVSRRASSRRRRTGRCGTFAETSSLCTHTAPRSRSDGSCASPTVRVSQCPRPCCRSRRRTHCTRAVETTRRAGSSTSTSSRRCCVPLTRGW